MAVIGKTLHRRRHLRHHDNASWPEAGNPPTPILDLTEVNLLSSPSITTPGSSTVSRLPGIMARTISTDEVKNHNFQTAETLSTLGLPNFAAYEFWSFNRIQQRAQLLTSSATSQYNELKKLTDSHFNQFQRRWMRKTNKQRRNVFKEAWGQMPENVCEGLTLFRAGVTRGMDDNQKNSYLLPELNLEQLRSDVALPTWVFSRSRHPPWKFLRFDFLRTTLAGNGTYLMVWPKDQLNGRLFEVNVDATPQSYGKLISYPTMEQYEAAKARDDKMVCAVGLLVFERQAKINQFLVKCFHTVMNDLSDMNVQNSLQPPFWPDLPAGSSSLATSVLRRLYLEPYKSSLSSLSTIIGSRLDGMRDHFWAMREDPAYFLDAITDAKDHVPIHFGNIQGKYNTTHTFLQSSADFDKLYPRYLTDYLIMLLTGVRTWTAIYEKVRILETTLDE